MNLNLLEKSTSRIGVQAIKSMLAKYGTEVDVYREKPYTNDGTMTPTRDVYGRYAGTRAQDQRLVSDQVNRAKLLIGGDPFNAHAASFDFGMPESVNAYALDTTLQVGDTIVIARDDSLRLQLEIIGKQGIGLSTNTLTRYELSPVPMPTAEQGALP